MEPATICEVLTVILFIVTINTSRTNADIYKKVGDKVILSPGSVPDRITVITWKHEKDTVLDWYPDNLKIYQEFKGRCTLNNITGELTISGLTLKDSGSYSAEVNDKVMDTTKIQVISAVPTPTVSKSSKPVDNPFIISSSNTQKPCWLFILVVSILVVVGVVFD